MVACFAIGLLCRLVVFTGLHVEGDEVVYTALVRQLLRGNPYNLVGVSYNGLELVGTVCPRTSTAAPCSSTRRAASRRYCPRCCSSGA